MIVVIMLTSAARGQVATPAKITLSPTSYVPTWSVPSNTRLYVTALGNRMQVPGNERIVMSGTITDQTGTGPAQVAWEIPGNFRLDRQTKPNMPIIYTPGAGFAAVAGLAQGDLDVLETFTSDSHESFLLTFRQPISHSLLGTRVRPDTGTTPNYTGPYLDIYEAIGPGAAINLVRQKWYMFDTATGRLAKTRYLIKRAGTNVAVESQFNNWVTQNGQSFATQVIRTEDGKPVLTFNATQATFGPALNDGLFTAH